MNRRSLAVLGACVAALAACSSTPSSTPRSTSPSSTSSTSASSTTTAATSGKLGTDHQVWLCKPGKPGDPCTASLTTTVVHADGTSTIQHASVAKDPKIDCFYVYPTVSAQPTVNANLHIDPAEVSVTIAQASRYSQVCRVFAPMYRQVTVAGLFNKKRTTNSGAIAYAGVLSAWKDYLRRYNDGRGVALIGHSQGSFTLRQLIKAEIDPNAAVRKLVVSAILMGGNFLVPKGKDIGGDSQHLPACRSNSQTGCIIAFSSFDHTPPANSLFGRANGSLGTSSAAGDRVLCTNPASLPGGAGPDLPYFPTHINGIVAQVGSLPKATTPWVSYPDLFASQCMNTGGASWLQIDDVRKPGDTRPHLHDTLGPEWGLHLYDGNIALGNLVDIVRDEASAYPAAG